MVFQALAWGKMHLISHSCHFSSSQTVESGRTNSRESSRIPPPHLMSKRKLLFILWLPKPLVIKLYSILKIFVKTEKNTLCFCLEFFHIELMYVLLPRDLHTLVQESPSPESEPIQWQIDSRTGPSQEISNGGSPKGGRITKQRFGLP